MLFARRRAAGGASTPARSSRAARSASRSVRSSAARASVRARSAARCAGRCWRSVRSAAARFRPRVRTPRLRRRESLDDRRIEAVGPRMSARHSLTTACQRARSGPASACAGLELEPPARRPPRRPCRRSPLRQRSRRWSRREHPETPTVPPPSPRLRGLRQLLRFSASSSNRACMRPISCRSPAAPPRAGRPPRTAPQLGVFRSCAEAPGIPSHSARARAISSGASSPRRASTRSHRDEERRSADHGAAFGLARVPPARARARRSPARASASRAPNRARCASIARVGASAATRPRARTTAPVRRRSPARTPPRRRAQRGGHRVETRQHQPDALLPFFVRRPPRRVRLVDLLNHGACALCDRLVLCARGDAVEQFALVASEAARLEPRVRARTIPRPCDRSSWRWSQLAEIGRRVSTAARARSADRRLAARRCQVLRILNAAQRRGAHAVVRRRFRHGAELLRIAQPLERGRGIAVARRRRRSRSRPAARTARVCSASSRSCVPGARDSRRRRCEPTAAPADAHVLVGAGSSAITPQLLGIVGQLRQAGAPDGRISVLPDLGWGLKRSRKDMGSLASTARWGGTPACARCAHGGACRGVTRFG